MTSNELFRKLCECRGRAAIGRAAMEHLGNNMGENAYYEKESEFIGGAIDGARSEFDNLWQNLNEIVGTFCEIEFDE